MVEGRQQRRIVALDGLRGVAAFLVLLTHGLLAGIAYRAYSPRAFVTWAGADAVAVFFVLSGFVLTLPVTSGELRLRGYYASRAVRLYLPVWGAIALAAILHVAADWRHVDGASWWLNVHNASLTAREAARDATLFKASGYAYVESLWSLRWEVVFSLLLPAYVLLGRTTRRWAVIAGAVALALIASEASGYSRYLPVFFLGTLLAFHVTSLRARWAALGAIPRLAIVAVTLVCCASGAWAPLGSTDGGISSMLQALGATLIVALAIASEAFDQLLASRPVKWLGSRSFALYLVQEPVVVSLAFLMGGQPETIVYLLVTIPVALLVADVFFRLVERPSHRLSRYARRRADAY